jgi:hypothetical protein
MIANCGVSSTPTKSCPPPSSRISDPAAHREDAHRDRDSAHDAGERLHCDASRLFIANCVRDGKYPKGDESPGIETKTPFAESSPERFVGGV